MFGHAVALQLAFADASVRAQVTRQRFLSAVRHVVVFEVELISERPETKWTRDASTVGTLQTAQVQLKEHRHDAGLGFVRLDALNVVH